mgnify:CR=1 FL=1
MLTQDLVVELILINSKRTLQEIQSMSRQELIRVLMEEKPGSEHEKQ